MSEPYVFDFRSGNTWGRALHGETMLPVKPDGMLRRLKDRWERRVRYSVLIHAPRGPRAGDHIVWKTAHGEVRATVDYVRHYGDPNDMYRIEVSVRPSGRSYA